MTREEIEGKIKKTKYYHYDNKVTVCFMTMQNDFIICGFSGVVDATKFDAIKGETLAYDDAFSKAWALEGYVEQMGIARILEINKLKDNE